VVVGRVLRRAVELAVGVHRRIAPVRGDQVVQVLLRIAPFPRRHDDVALDTLWPWRLHGRQFALGDAIGPVAEVLERRAAEHLRERVQHEGRGLTRLYATNPRRLPGFELTE